MNKNGHNTEHKYAINENKLLPNTAFHLFTYFIRLSKENCGKLEK